MPTPNVFVCVGCDEFAFSYRTDALTCSPACRVRAHRNGRLKEVRKEAERESIPPGIIVRAMATKRLAPDWAERICSSNRYTLDHARGPVWEAFPEHLKAHGLL